MIFDGWLGLQMRAFYKSYPNEAIVQQPAAQIPWFHKSKALPEELRGNLPSIEEVETELEGMGGTGGKLRMACEELFDVLPENWTWMTLGQACADGGGDIQTGPFGSQLHASDYVPEGIPSIMPQNIGDNRIILDGIAHIKQEDAKRLKRYLVKNGDIVYSRRGDVKLRALIRNREEGWLCGTGCLRIRLGQGIADPNFVSFYLGHPAVKNWIVQHAIGATMPNLNTSILSSLPIILPPLPEQRAIARILGSLDDKIEANRRMNETLEAIARALFKSWFVDFDPVRAKMDGHRKRGYSLPGQPAHFYDLFSNRLVDSELGEIPEGWGVQKLSKLCTLGRGASPRPINDYMNGEVPWIKIADATAASGPFLFETKEKVKTAGVEKSVAVVPGDLILSNSATCGVPMFVELHGCIHDGWLYFKNFRSISKIYLFHVLIELAEHLVHIADGSVQKNLNTNLVGQQNVLVPPKALVDGFDAQASVLFCRMRQNGLESRALTALRNALLPKLIRGQIHVKDAEDFLMESGL